MPVRPTHALVPAAGLGTRMRPLTYACPKELLPVGARPVIHRLMEELIEAGITDVCVVTSAEKPALAEYLQRVELPLRLSFALQERPGGLGDALLYGREFAAGNPVLIALGDSLIESQEAVSPLRRMIGLHESANAGVILGEVVPVERLSRYGVMDPVERAALEEETFALRSVVEKPPVERAPSRVAISARYLLPFELFDALEGTPLSESGELTLTDAIVKLLRDGFPLFGLKLRETERRWDIGGFETYFDAFDAYAARDRAAWRRENS